MFTSAIKEASKNLTAKERIALKDTTRAIKLDEATQHGDVEIVPSMWAILGVHNDKLVNPDYEQFVVQDANGDTYVTGSNSFWQSFMDIFTEMEGEDEEYSIVVTRIPSKNYNGKEFLSCYIK